MFRFYILQVIRRLGSNHLGPEVKNKHVELFGSFHDKSKNARRVKKISVFNWDPFFIGILSP